MKHSGKASLAAIKLIALSGAAIITLLTVAFLAKWIAIFFLSMAWVLIGLWVLFVAFSFYFFRDPNPLTPTGANFVISPGHGKVDMIDTIVENDFIGGECQRVSIFLSVFDVHVQNAPVAGRVTYFKHMPGEYLNAMKADSAKYNENVLIGIESIEPRGEKIGVRLIAGLIARRIVPWIQQNDAVQRGERISLIQFGSRVDVYLPKRAKIKVNLGDRVVGGETVIASFD
ncbi:MAG TPA: phosphatidylserine decarboxylase [Verrucomicrobiae bacterium]|nr:phosphatidylserine decarboxylase [Verrucomicrobiae bacterium]